MLIHGSESLRRPSCKLITVLRQAIEFAKARAQLSRDRIAEDAQSVDCRWNLESDSQKRTQVEHVKEIRKMNIKAH